MEDLLAQDTYRCGTLRSNRKDLPACAKNKLKQGEKVSGKLVFTKWHDKRDISLLPSNVLPSEAPHIHIHTEITGQISTLKSPM